MELDALNATLSALGRAMLLLDADMAVLWASESLDGLVCPGASCKALSHPVSDLLGSELFAAGSPLRQALAVGGREEGRRAFLRCPHLGARLVSVTAARLTAEQRRRLRPDARTLVVLRPAEDEHLALERGAAGRGMVALSAPMLRLVHTIEQAQHSEATVLVTGESGTGKELVARLLHDTSPRQGGPFVAINCGAVPPDLLESELFGHVRGAFTGAVADRVGRFEQARGGTLLLDEIGDMPLALQVKLLRVLQERSFSPVGSNRSIELDARIVASTHVDLQEAIDAGRFRADLFYRLAVLPLPVPPLRERGDEIEPLARHFLSRACLREGKALVFSPDAIKALQTHDWPGNVRELENAVEYAAVLCPVQTVGVEHLPASVLTRRPVDTTEPEDDEQHRIRRALEEHHWHRADAARTLGMSRTTLWRKMREHGLL